MLRTYVCVGSIHAMSTRARTRIVVKLAIDLDLDAWVADIGGSIADADGNYKVADARNDVREYVLNMIQQSSVLAEADAEVNLA